MSDTEDSNDNVNIVRFPLRRACAGRVHCPPLNIHFPQLYRVLQKISRAQLAAEGMPFEQPVAEFVHYTLSEESNYAGIVRVQPVQSISDEDMDSVVIRHHRSMDEACAYLEGVMDVCGDGFTDVICKTDEGFFTMAWRATETAWPGPMVFYAAKHDADNLAGFDDWQMAVAPDGTAAEGDYL